MKKTNPGTFDLKEWKKVYEYINYAKYKNTERCLQRLSLIVIIQKKSSWTEVSMENALMEYVLFQHFRWTVNGRWSFNH